MLSPSPAAGELGSGLAMGLAVKFLTELVRFLTTASMDTRMLNSVHYHRLQVGASKLQDGEMRESYPCHRHSYRYARVG